MIKGLSGHATRWVTGLILAAIALSCLIFGGMPLLLLVSVMVVLVSKEYVKMLENKGFYPSLKIILFADAIFAIMAYLNCISLVPLVFTIGTIMAFVLVLFKGKQPYIANVSTTILGFVYSGWFPLHLLFLRDIGANNVTSWQMIFKSDIVNDGLGYVIFLFIVVLLTDIGGYYFGRNFGKHKLAPVISPNKTIEGSIGGVFSALVGALIVGHFINLPLHHTLIAGFLLTTFAQLGDLSESLMKRDAGVKDSGDSLPGHGGFLDRTDSFLFTIPVAYYYFNYFVASDYVVKNVINFIKGIF